MGRLLSTVVAVVFLLAACGDDSTSDDSTGDENAEAPSTSLSPESDGEATPEGSGDAEGFCDAYRAAQLSAENPASTDQFSDLTPPEELEDVWSDYLDSDFDAGVTVDGFVAENCFDDLTAD